MHNTAQLQNIVPAKYLVTLKYKRSNSFPINKKDGLHWKQASAAEEQYRDLCTKLMRDINQSYRINFLVSLEIREICSPVQKKRRLGSLRRIRET